MLNLILLLLVIILFLNYTDELQESDKNIQGYNNTNYYILDNNYSEYNYENIINFK